MPQTTLKITACHRFYKDQDLQNFFSKTDYTKRNWTSNRIYLLVTVFFMILVIPDRAGNLSGMGLTSGYRLRNVKGLGPVFAILIIVVFTVILLV